MIIRRIISGFRTKNSHPDRAFAEMEFTLLTFRGCPGQVECLRQGTQRSSVAAQPSSVMPGQLILDGNEPCVPLPVIILMTHRFTLATQPFGVTHRLLSVTAAPHVTLDKGCCVAHEGLSKVTWRYVTLLKRHVVMVRRLSLMHNDSVVMDGSNAVTARRLSPAEKGDAAIIMGNTFPGLDKFMRGQRAKPALCYTKLSLSFYEFGY